VTKSYASDGRRKKTMRSKYPTVYRSKKKGSDQTDSDELNSSSQLVHLYKNKPTNYYISFFTSTTKAKSTRKLQIPHNGVPTISLPSLAILHPFSPSLSLQFHPSKLCPLDRNP